VSENLSAGNARVFARTDFDRYADFDGARIDLYSVTMVPLAVERTAKVGTLSLPLESVDESPEVNGSCWVWRDPAARFRLRVAAGSVVRLPAGRQRVVLRTCEPRVEATPAEIETNEIESLE
jgi:hypothetical protein